MPEGDTQGYAYAGSSSLRLAAGLYLASIFFNAMHFAFGLCDMALIEIVTGEAKVNADYGKDKCTAMADWVNLNVVRGLVDDLPGALSSLLAFVVASTS